MFQRSVTVSGKVEVMGRVSVDRGREQQRVTCAGRVRALAPAARHGLGQAHVGVDREVVAVVLERRRRDHDHDVVAPTELAQLLPGVLLVAQVRHDRRPRRPGWC